MPSPKTQADRTADALLELNRARCVVEAVKSMFAVTEPVDRREREILLSASLEYYEGCITYDQYQSFLTQSVKKSAQPDTTLPQEG